MIPGKIKNLSVLFLYLSSPWFQEKLPTPVFIDDGLLNLRINTEEPMKTSSTITIRPHGIYEMEVEWPNLVRLVTRFFANSTKSGDKITKSGHSKCRLRI